MLRDGFIQRLDSLVQFILCAVSVNAIEYTTFPPLCVLSFVPSLSLFFFSSPAVNKMPVSGHLPTSHHASVVYHISHLTPPTFSKPPYEYQSHQTCSMFEKGHSAAMVSDWLCPIHLNPPSASVSVYPTRGTGFGEGVCAFFFFLRMNRM